jgi:hypothetical protein
VAFCTEAHVAATSKVMAIRDPAFCIHHAAQPWADELAIARGESP